MNRNPTHEGDSHASRQAPLHVISLGAGVQSSTMALMAAHGEITPMPELAVFADTQDEPASVYKWLDYIEGKLPFPIHRVTAGKLSDSALDVRLSATSGNTYTKTGLPVFTVKNGNRGIGMRQCTRSFKIEPIRKFLRVLGKPIIQWIGISRDEAHRMKPSRDSWITNIWPLVERNIKRGDCLSWMKANGYDKPPRSACSYCPYHSDNEWRRLRDEEPEEFAKAIDFEKRLQAAYASATALKSKPFLHSSLVPLSEVDFRTDEDHGQQVMFGNECEGMCGV